MQTSDIPTSIQVQSAAPNVWAQYGSHGISVRISETAECLSDEHKEKCACINIEAPKLVLATRNVKCPWTDSYRRTTDMKIYHIHVIQCGISSVEQRGCSQTRHYPQLHQMENDNFDCQSSKC
ncbi:hypothetical protein Mapa_000129 [Marchantia paleacea]|nr:hypothetical protein Mapa_000129 [Marchantia paleacea]